MIQLMEKIPSDSGLQPNFSLTILSCIPRTSLGKFQTQVQRVPNYVLLLTFPWDKKRQNVF